MMMNDPLLPRSQPSPRGEPINPRRMGRREFLLKAAAGAPILALGSVYVLAGEDEDAKARAMKRPDGQPRLPPGQHVITKLKPMGGTPGEPGAKSYRLKVHGDVEKPFTLDFKQLLGLPQEEIEADVHCVTTWSVIGATWKGVSIATLAEKAGVKDTARHVIFEAAHGYTANAPLDEVVKPGNLIAHRHEGRPLARAHGAPVRALVPDLYFWKSAKWLVGIRFAERDEPGFWETRGYHNHADPWKEERHA